jgi:hypothetical protein
MCKRQKCTCGNRAIASHIQGDQKVSVHLIITTQNPTWLNLTAWQPTARTRGAQDSH